VRGGGSGRGKRVAHLRDPDEKEQEERGGGEGYENRDREEGAVTRW